MNIYLKIFILSLSLNYTIIYIYILYIYIYIYIYIWSCEKDRERRSVNLCVLSKLNYGANGISNIPHLIPSLLSTNFFYIRTQTKKKKNRPHIHRNICSVPLHTSWLYDVQLTIEDIHWFRNFSEAIRNLASKHFSVRLILTWGQFCVKQLGRGRLKTEVKCLE